MEIYLTFRSCWFLEKCSRKELGRAWRKTLPKTFLHWQPWVGLLLSILLVVLAASLAEHLPQLLGSASGVLLSVTRFLVCLAGIVLAKLIFQAFTYRIAVWYMAEELGIYIDPQGS